MEEHMKSVMFDPNSGQVEVEGAEFSEKLELSKSVIKQEAPEKPIVKENDLSFITAIDGEFAAEEPDEILEELSSSEEVSAEIDPIEAEARAQNWVPRDEFKGDPNTWVDAKSFVERGSFFKKIESQNRRIKELDSIVKTMASTLSQKEERQYKEAIDYLNNQISAAESEGDLKTYASASRQAKELEEAYRQHQQTAPPLQIQDPQDQVEAIKATTEFQQFSVQAPWINRDDPLSKAKKTYASELTTAYETANPSATLKEKFDLIIEKVREAFPDEGSKVKAAAPARALASPSSAPRSAGSGLTYGQALGQLDGAQRAVVEYLKRTGQDYKAYLKEALPRGRK